MKLNSLAVLLFFFLGACSKTDKHAQHSVKEEQHQHEATVYTCPMHPEIESNQPGTCPKCKMNLELKVNEAKDQVELPNKQVLSKQATVKLKSQSAAQDIKSQGYIDIDKSRNRNVAARFGGRIEKLYVAYNLQRVTKDQKILEIYSPELNTFQEEHLFLLKNEQEKSLIEQSRQKLKLFGLTDRQVSDLEATRKVKRTISVFSPYDGYVFFNAVSGADKTSQTTQEPSMGGMNGSEPKVTGKNYNTSGVQIKEGDYVNLGEILFSINDLQKVWAIVSVSSNYVSQIKPKSSVKIISELFPERPLNGKLLLTEKTFEEAGQRFVRLRIELTNPKNALKINSLLVAETPIGLSDTFQVPVSAVYKTGLNSYVWVKKRSTAKGTGIFQLRKVSTGQVINGRVEIIGGLKFDEEIALHAGLLIDSETFINEN
ncbi:efflux RND transporter periplasmic adaptor subunit [Flavobacterium sp. H122]|uniref:efflux RND transporter periplasmic adaptor subunit n=1 Tax=Flavobacterium sp. H122 TaxID=2529860 RepID=UPI00145A09DD|nr:efflux RND transporter periplasmic adaptor subunit [Flavobacterium sp. H122]